jgi:hypothetical protein
MQAMFEISQLPQYGFNIENIVLEATVDSRNDDDEYFFFHNCEYADRRKVHAPPTNSMKCWIDDGKVEKIVYLNGTADIPNVSEPFEPEWEPDLLQPVAYAGMVRQVTEENWYTWKTRQWEPDVELDISSKKTSTSSRCWADMNDDIPDAGCNCMKKESTVLSGALGMATESDLAPTTHFDHMSANAIAASKILGGTCDQQQTAPEDFDTKVKRRRRRKREGGSLIDVAFRRSQKHEKQQNQQTHQNSGFHEVAPKNLVPRFCNQCGGRRLEQHNFCMFCGAR